MDPSRNRTIIAIISIAMLLSTSGPYLWVSDSRDNHVANAQVPSDDASTTADGSFQITNSTVSGRYDYLQTAHIAIPENWRGVEISESGTSTVMVAVAPSGISSLDDLTTADPIIVFLLNRKSDVDVAPGHTLPSLLDSSVNGTNLDCRLESSKFRLVSGAFSEESIYKCGDANLLHSILLQTNSRWIALMLYGTSQQVALSERDFETTISSLMVSGAVNLTIPFGFPTFNAYNIDANGTTVQVEVKSTNNITGFRLDEETKAISFRALGFAGLDGITEILIGGVLEGPYIVTVNGVTWDNFSVQEGSTPDATRIVIRYEDEMNDIMIKGTQIVPEFVAGTIGTSGAIFTAMGIVSGLVGLAVLRQLNAGRYV